MPIPSQGWRKLLYWFNDVQRGRPDLVPALSKSEQVVYDQKQLDLAAAIQKKKDDEAELARQEQAARDMKELIQSSIARLRDLTDIAPTASCAFLNSKGAAATTVTTVNTASVFAEDTRTVLIVGDFNPAAGTSAARLGKDHGSTMTVERLSDALDDKSQRMDEFQTFISGIRPTRYGVRVISAAPIVGRNRRLEADKCAAILAATRPMCEYLLADTPNDITEPVMEEVVKASDILVFTANVGVHDSLRQLATSMETLRQQGHTDKVNRSVVVISNLPPGAKLDDYRKYLHFTNIKDEVVQEYAFDGQFLGIPHHPVISLDGIVDLGALSPEIVQAYRMVGIAFLEQVIVGQKFDESKSHDSTTHPHSPLV